jgi:hypothetical protein
VSLAEIAPQVQGLTRAEKFRLVQMLVTELAEQDAMSLLKPGQDYPMWSPYDETAAGRLLLDALAQERARQ